jgi:hypothetical protein
LTTFIDHRHPCRAGTTIQRSIKINSPKKVLDDSPTKTKRPCEGVTSQIKHRGIAVFCTTNLEGLIRDQLCTENLLLEPHIHLSKSISVAMQARRLHHRRDSRRMRESRPAIARADCLGFGLAVSITG